jgi:hypothetical protein
MFSFVPNIIQHTLVQLISEKAYSSIIMTEQAQIIKYVVHKVSQLQ